MKASFEATLRVNSEFVDLNPFVEEFLVRIATGAVSTLKGAEDIESLELYLEQGNVRIIVNGAEIPLATFPNDIIANTLIGLVSSLRGVPKVDSLDISVKVH